ncbi:hypothetical protein ACZ11_05785 [Lysinibacillus xylanilyticus]|uniref:Uncharacterized protein n=1 Tax=Lysinibacillus xylanilyticus TaxID=582475 RepID=A0A0K9FBV9_9BACI|nr:hypothetical protein [Lysinibacillus xylanilyticus]KMY31713.1 hypothetical protein ACZ11_05785 [Lysinibacillus xylanilyticus]
MKKIFYIGVLSTLILTACSEDEAASKEEAPASEQKEAKEKTVNAYTEEISENNPIDEAAKELHTKYIPYDE